MGFGGVSGNPMIRTSRVLVGVTTAVVLKDVNVALQVPRMEASGVPSKALNVGLETHVRVLIVVSNLNL